MKAWTVPGERLEVRFFGGGDSPKAPDAPPPPPKKTDTEIAQERARQRQSLRNRRGRQATALTPGGVAGDTDPAGGQAPQLLGGARA